jgi:conjugative transfer region protein (TIGR03748 family)
MLNNLKIFRIFVGFWVGMVGCIVMVPLSFAQSTTVDRYLVITNKPLPAQADLLQQTFQVRFPHHVQTILEAVNYLLRFSGYQLVNSHQLPIEARIVLSKPLPEIDRKFGPLSLREGLLMLVGEPFDLLVDPIHREIAFQLKKDYPSLATGASSWQ